MTKLGAALLDVGALSPAALNRALEVQQTAGGRLGTVLLEQALVTEETLARALAKVSGREYARWETVRAAPQEVIALVPAKIALRAFVIPFSREGRILRVAMRDPNDLATEDELSFVTGKKIEPCVLAEFRLAEGLERFYGKQRTARFRLLADKIDRGLLRPGAAAPRPAPPPPPPPPAFGGAAPPGSRSGRGRFSDVWKTEAAGPSGEDIEISTWKPAPRPQPTPVAAPSASLELEYTPELPEPETPPAEAHLPLEDAAARMRRVETRTEIGDAALQCLAGDFPLVGLFIARKEDAIGWRLAADGASQTDFQSLRIPFSEPSLFLNVRLSSSFYQGALPPLPAHEPLVRALGRRPERCALFPVVLKKRVVAFLMVEPKTPVLTPGEVGRLNRLAEAMAEGFGTLILAQRSRKEPA